MAVQSGRGGGTGTDFRFSLAKQERHDVESRLLPPFQTGSAANLVAASDHCGCSMKAGVRNGVSRHAQCTIMRARSRSKAGMGRGCGRPGAGNAVAARCRQPATGVASNPAPATPRRRDV